MDGRDPPQDAHVAPGDVSPLNNALQTLDRLSARLRAARVEVRHGIYCFFLPVTCCPALLARSHAVLLCSPAHVSVLADGAV